jgi:hypothetical protein
MRVSNTWHSGLIYRLVVTDLLEFLKPNWTRGLSPSLFESQPYLQEIWIRLQSPNWIALYLFNLSSTLLAVLSRWLWDKGLSLVFRDIRLIQGRTHMHAGGDECPPKSFKMFFKICKFINLSPQNIFLSPLDFYFLFFDPSFILKSQKYPWICAVSF